MRKWRTHLKHTESLRTTEVDGGRMWSMAFASSGAIRGKSSILREIGGNQEPMTLRESRRSFLFHKNYFRKTSFYA